MDGSGTQTHGDEALAVMSFPRGVPFIVILTQNYPSRCDACSHWLSRRYLRVHISQP